MEVKGCTLRQAQQLFLLANGDNEILMLAYKRCLPLSATTSDIALMADLANSKISLS